MELCSSVKSKGSTSESRFAVALLLGMCLSILGESTTVVLRAVLVEAEDFLERKDELVKGWDLRA
jgi:hypothetical protein